MLNTILLALKQEYLTNYLKNALEIHNYICEDLVNFQNYKKPSDIPYKSIIFDDMQSFKQVEPRIILDKKAIFLKPTGLKKEILLQNNIIEIYYPSKIFLQEILQVLNQIQP